MQWAAGTFCAIVGALVFVTPHQFIGPAYALLAPVLPLWGVACLLTGLALLAVVTFASVPALVRAVNLLAGASIALLGISAGSAGGWTGLVTYLTFGLATAIAPWLAAQDGESYDRGPDLFALAVATGAGLNGILMLAVPSQYGSVIFDLVRPYLTWYGCAFLLGGLAVLVVQLRRGVPPVARWLAHLLLAGALVSFGPLTFLPNRAFTALAYYSGFAVLIALLPWLGPWINRMNRASLRVRLALSLVMAAALPLVVATGLSGEQEERLATREILDRQETLATSLSEAVAEYVGLHRAAVSIVAATPGLEGMSADDQRALLVRFSQTYPDIVASAVVDASGQRTARSDDVTPASFAGLSMFEETRRSNQPVVDVRAGRVTGQALFAFAAPIHGADGSFRGAVVAALSSSRVSGLLQRAAGSFGLDTYLVDSNGRAIAHTNDAIARSQSDLSASAPVSAFLRREAERGSLVYGPFGRERFASFATVPGLGWGVLMDHPAAVSLAGTRAGRDVAFGILVLVSALAAVLGAAAAGWLVAPLGTLVGAVRRLAAGDSAAPLPRSPITEVATLAGAFAEMRDRLSERTAEQQRAEQELRESESRFRTMADSAPNLIWISGPDAARTYFNEGWLRFTGRTIAQETGTGWTEGIHPDDVECCLAAYQAAFQARQSVDLEYRLRRADGAFRWIVDRGVPLFLADGTFNGYIGSCIDITERKQVEESMRFLAEASAILSGSLDYETTLDSLVRVPVPALADLCTLDVVDEDGAVHRVAVAVSDPSKAAFAETLKRYPPDPDGPGPVSRVLRGGRSQIQEQMPSGVRERVARSAEHLAALNGIGGQAAMCVPFKARGRTIGAMSFWSVPRPGRPDRRYTAADLALAEELARRAAVAVEHAELYREAQEAVAARDQFLSVAAHELRTPVAGIKGYAQLLLRAFGRGPVPQERVAQTLHRINEVSDRLTHLTRDLLDVSRLRTGQFAIDARPVDVVPMLRDIVTRYRAQLSETHELRVELTLGPCIISGDRDRLEQVIVNLLENAAKYSPPGGVIYLRAREDAGGVLLSVHDEGIGLPPGAAEAIFEPFGRAANAVARQVPGMGLGLHICRSIVERHAGRIWASSDGDGRGTTVSVWLPGLDSTSPLDSPPTETAARA